MSKQEIENAAKRKRMAEMAKQMEMDEVDEDDEDDWRSKYNKIFNYN